MTPYVVFFSLYLTLYFALEAIAWRRAELSRPAGCLMILPLAIFAMIYAGHISIDSINYGLIYESPQDFPVEPGFALLMVAAKHAGLSYFVFMKIFVAVQLLLLTAIVARARDPLFFMLVYFAAFYLNFQFNQVRSAMALFIIVASYLWLRRFSFFMLLPAVAIHYSAPISFGLQFLAKSRHQRMAIGLVLAGAALMLAMFVLPQLIDSDLLKAIFVYKDYLELEFEGKRVYPALLVKLAIVWILFRNGGSRFYLITYAILVVFIHLVSPILNRICELVLFLALTEFCIQFRLRHNWSRLLVIGLALVLVLSSLLIPWTDCQKGGPDNWCIARSPG
jgi:hypothetical protein